MASPPPLLVGLDIGTTLIKAGLVSSAGDELTTQATSTPWQQVGDTILLRPGSLADAVRQVLVSLLRTALPGEIVGVGISSIAETAVLLDRRSAPLADLYPWHDRRAQPYLERLREAFGRETIAAITGLASDQVPTLSMLQWLADNGVDLDNAECCLSVAEWVATLLGGDRAAEPSLACRTGAFCVREHTWWTEALDWAGVPSRLFPPTRAAGTSWGHTPSMGEGLERLSGAHLTVAGHDHVVAGVGVGALDPSVVLDSCGTAEALIRLCGAQAIPEPDSMRARKVSLGAHVLDDQYYLLVGFPLGLELRHVLETLGHEATEGRTTLDRQVMDALVSPRAPLPEGPAAWRDALVAAAAATTSGLRELEALTGPIRDLIVTGGWSANPVLHHLKSRSRPLRYPHVAEAGVRGAALIAGLAAGQFSSSKDFPIPLMTSTPWQSAN